MTSDRPNAIVYCEGAFNTPNGKTAHGLVRFTRRYNVIAVVDSRYPGQDAGTVLDGSDFGIPISADLEDAVSLGLARNAPATHFVVGLAPDGGRLAPAARVDVETALAQGMHVVCGLHDFLSEDPELAALAERNGVTITDVRKPPPRSEQHFFSGDIEKVAACKVAVLGTDSAVGKRTTAWKIVEALEALGWRSEMIGTGQTAWMQGARYSTVADSLVSDFVAGEIEHAIYRAWTEQQPDAIVIEGQGSIMNPAYPGGFELLAAGRPDVIVLQHAPARRDYDGFPGYPIHPLPHQIQVLEMLSGKPVAAIAVNHEDIPREDLATVCDTIERTIGLPTVDVLVDGPDKLATALVPFVESAKQRRKGRR